MNILVDSKGVYKSSGGDYFKVLGIQGTRCYAEKGKDGPDGEIVYSGTHYWFLINGQVDEVDHGNVLVEKLCGELF